MHELIGDITLCILFAWVLGLLAHFSRQPLILAYLIAGFFIGPFGMGWVKSQESINVISKLGLIFMLFMIGLEIDLKKIVRAGKVILFAAGGQLIGGVLLGILFFIGIGFSMGSGHFDALYLCVACALSSTVIIVKVLYEKRELDTLPGRITLGVLVLQDIFAILFLAVQPSLDNLQISVILISIARVGVLVATALVLSRYVLPRLFHQIARRPELILLGALAWCFLIGEIAEKLHLSREMGSLVAGVSLSTFPYALDVTAKVTTLRDFFITLFFVALGMTIPIPNGSVIGLALIIAAFTVVILGFFRAASALLSQIERQNESLLQQITVIDFNPNVFRILNDRGVHVIYGDISNVDTLVHAGIGKAEIIILSVPDSLLVGANN